MNTKIFAMLRDLLARRRDGRFVGDAVNTAFSHRPHGRCCQQAERNGVIA
jgi:hypothetical protein